jgi:hypothetical protein
MVFVTICPKIHTNHLADAIPQKLFARLDSPWAILEMASLFAAWYVDSLILVAVVLPLNKCILPAAGRLFPVCGRCHYALPAAVLIMSFVSGVWRSSRGPPHQASLFVIQLIPKHRLPLPGLRVPFLLS